jgi:signal transduction histidine kinase
MFGSIPWDIAEAPRWMLAEDIVGGLAYLGLPLVNRLGYLTASRLLCITISNLIVLGNAIFLGHDSGAELVLLALVAIPFSLFDLTETAALVFGAALAIAGLSIAHLDAVHALRNPSEGFSSASYHGYSAVVALVGLLFTLFQTSLLNARAERALREDIKERQRAERELELTRQTSVYSAKMAALGEMSGNIAHEVNNPLAAILLRAQGLRRLIDKDRLDTAAVSKAATDIETIVHRIKGIVDALRSFARDAQQDPLQPGSVRQIVRDTVELCAQRFSQHSIELSVGPIPEDLYVDCRGVQISQILLNLLGNAHDAVENRPTRWVRIGAEADERQVRIAVVDSGPGISPEVATRIMEPFFTTKEIGKGTGLGLSVSKGIAESHGGRLTYDPTPANTRFVLTLRRTRPTERDLLGSGPIKRAT